MRHRRYDPGGLDKPRGDFRDIIINPNPKIAFGQAYKERTQVQSWQPAIPQLSYNKCLTLLLLVHLNMPLRQSVSHLVVTTTLRY